MLLALVVLAGACGDAGSPPSDAGEASSTQSSASGNGSAARGVDDSESGSAQSAGSAELIPSVTLPPAAAPVIKVHLSATELCDLLTPEEVESIMGRPMAAEEDDVLDRCAWLTAGYQQGDGGLYIGMSPGRNLFDNFLVVPDAERVDGPWDDAVYWREPLGQIDFHLLGGQQSMGFSITGVHIQQEGDFRAEIAEIARLAYERVPAIDLGPKLNAPEPDPDVVIGLYSPTPYSPHPVWWSDTSLGGEGLVDPMTGESTAIESDGVRRRDPAWSPDAAMVAMTSFESGDTGIVSSSLHVGPSTFAGPWETHDLPAGELPPNAANATIGDPVWSVDGRIYFIVGFSVGEERMGEVWAFDPATKEMARVQTTEALVTQIAASPDGSQLIVASDHLPSFMDPTTGMISEPIGFAGQVTDWSPDGARLLYHFDGDIWTSLADGSEAVQLTRTPDISESNASYSFDGGFIVYRSNAVEGNSRFQAWAMNADGSSPRSLTPGLSVASGF